MQGECSLCERETIATIKRGEVQCVECGNTFIASDITTDERQFTDRERELLLGRDSEESEDE